MPESGSRQLAGQSLRDARRDALSLALIDSRNHTLRWIAVYEQAQGADALRRSPAPGIDPPLWTLGHIGWYQERWIARNIQRGRGAACDPTQPPLAPIRADADRWFDPQLASTADRVGLDFPDLQALRNDLAAGIELALELLEAAADSDEELYFFRLVLCHESRFGESLATDAQSLGLPLGDAGGLLAELVTPTLRPPLQFPATRWTLGSPPIGFALDNELPMQPVDVPEFEIDSQPVSWAQYAEFVADGGYDDPRWWSEAGWRWVQQTERRVPRHVSQMRHGVLLQRFGQIARVPLGQPAMHLAWFEAEAWCRWAGRRLPSEVEWEVAVHQGASRGFRWGDVWEWTASTFRPYPGFEPGPDRSWSQPCFGVCKVLRGASFATAARLRHRKFRHFLRPERDDAFCGFRSCAV